MALTQKLDLRPKLVSIWERINRGEEGKKKKEEEEAKLRYGTMAMSMGLWIFV